LPANNQHIVWLNGGFIPVGEARISPYDRGFLYGDGLFETMRAENGRVIYLEEHLSRLLDSAKILNINYNTSDELSEIIEVLLEKNDLRDQVARVKIILTRGEVPGLGLPESVKPTLLITADRYAPHTDSQYAAGWQLISYRQGYTPPLSPHKSLNYLYFLAARQAASDAGADDALILDPNGLVTETAAASLLVKSGGAWWTPESPYQLPGTALSAVIRLMEKDGQIVVRRPGTLNDLLSSQTVWALNSLMGVMPVRTIDSTALPELAVDEAASIRRRFFEGP